MSYSEFLNGIFAKYIGMIVPFVECPSVLSRSGVHSLKSDQGQCHLFCENHICHNF